MLSIILIIANLFRVFIIVVIFSLVYRYVAKNMNSKKSKSDKSYNYNKVLRNGKNYQANIKPTEEYVDFEEIK